MVAAVFNVGAEDKGNREVVGKVFGIGAGLFALETKFNGVGIGVHLERGLEGDQLAFANGYGKVPDDGSVVLYGEPFLAVEREFVGIVAADDPRPAAAEEGVAVDGNVGVEIGGKKSVVFAA